jgi:outer membrane receptor for ferrienterochelin and colicin
MRALLACLLVLWPALSAHAQGTSRVDLAEEADLQFRLGVDAYRAGQWSSALEHLLASNRLVPNHNVAFNIARCYEQLGLVTEAFRHYGDFVDRETSPAARSTGLEALDRLRPRVALLRVETEPAGAIVFIDREDLGARGATPQRLAVRPGEHRVIVQLAGYESPPPTAVTATQGAETVVQLRLSRVVGRVSVTGSPPGAEIRVDGQPDVLGTVPAALELAPGPRVLELSAPGRKSERLGLTVEPRGTHALRADLAVLTGALVVDADESGALIEVNGAPAGFTPTVIDPVPVGRHRVRVSLRGFKPWETDVDVTANARLSVTAELRPLNEVTAASRVAESVDDAPASVTLITADELRAFGFTTLNDALAGLRGVFQTDDRTYSAIGIRGFSRPGDYGNRVLVLLDGHPMNDDQLGSSYVAEDFQADLSHVRRIELVRGPGSALYGSNAFFGVINVVTWASEAPTRPTFGVTADGRRTARARAQAGWRHSKLDLGVNAYVAATRADGDDLRLTDGRFARGADGSESMTAHVRAFAGDFTLQGNFNSRDKRIPTGAYGTLIADPRARATDTRAFVEARWEPTLSPNLSLQTRAALDLYTFAGRYPYASPPEDVGLLSDDWAGRWASGEARLRATPWESLTLTLGGEARTTLDAVLTSDDAVSENLAVDDDRVRAYAGYAVVAIEPLAALTVSVGARYDHFSTVGSTLSPRLALIARPSDRDVVKAIVGQAFRAPSPYERLYDDGGTTQIQAQGLEPETVQTLELEYTRVLSADLRIIGGAFYNRIDALIDLASVPSPEADASTLVQYDNLSEPTQTVGAELELRRDWRRGAMLSASWAWQRTRVGDLSRGAALSNSPAHLAGLRAAVPVGRTGATLANRLRLESPRETTAGTTSAWRPLWDVTVTGDLPAEGLRWGLGVRNAFDQRTTHPVSSELAPLSDVPQSSRSLFASLDLTL